MSGSLGSAAPVAPREVRRNGRAIALMLSLLALYTVADLASKQWALGSLSRAYTQPVPLCQSDEDGHILGDQRMATSIQTFIPGVLDMHYAENCGAAFGMLRAAPSWLRALVFGVAALGASVVLIAMFARGSGGPPFAAAVPLILSGAIGNLSDRVRHGYVVDFIQVNPRLFQYPTFNVADIAITIGVVLLLIDGMKKPASAADALDRAVSKDSV